VREVPQSSTQVSPWQMAFGFLPRVPCAILKDTCTGVKPLPNDLAKPVADYLYELQDKLAIASDFATEYLMHGHSSSSLVESPESRVTLLSLGLLFLAATEMF
jgi:hypothetical protein